jgi:hypothetical protein
LAGEVSTEAEEIPLLEAFTRKQLVMTEKTLRVL